MMELPAYHWPTVRNIAIGLWQRVLIFCAAWAASSWC
jgi:ferrous iron transport protein B